MNELHSGLKICLSVLASIFIITLVVYFTIFSGGISNNTENWLLFVSICNWGFISLLTGLNVWVFFKLTTLIARNDNNRFIESKISRSENAILDLRINDYKLLREQAINLKLAVLKSRDFKRESQAFMKILLSMQDSRLFDTIDNKGSVMDEVVKYVIEASESEDADVEKFICQIDNVLRTIELLNFSQQLRDDRLLGEIRKHPNRFDVTLIGIDNLINRND